MISRVYFGEVGQYKERLEKLRWFSDMVNNWSFILVADNSPKIKPLRLRLGSCESGHRMEVSHKGRPKANID